MRWPGSIIAVVRGACFSGRGASGASAREILRRSFREGDWLEAEGSLAKRVAWDVRPRLRMTCGALAGVGRAVGVADMERQPGMYRNPGAIHDGAPVKGGTGALTAMCDIARAGEVTAGQQGMRKGPRLGGACRTARDSRCCTAGTGELKKCAARSMATPN
jgi:hypothetical protein